MSKERTCANCGAIAKKGIHCRDCTVVWLIAERMESYLPMPKERIEFIEDLEARKIVSPRGMMEDAKSKAAKAMMNLAGQIDGFLRGFTSPEIPDLMARGYNLAKRDAKRLESAKAKQETASELPSQEVENVKREIKRETWAKMGHLVDGRDKDAYRGFDPTKTEMEDEPIF